MIDRVFVYGTLNPFGRHFNQWLVEGELGITEWEEAETKGTRLPSGGAWDYVWFHEDGDPIQGAVLVIGTSKDVLDRLDRYEGYDPSYATCHFIRKRITLSDGTEAWGYEYGVTKEEVQAWRRHNWSRH